MPHRDQIDEEMIFTNVLPEDIDGAIGVSHQVEIILVENERLGLLVENGYPATPATVIIALQIQSILVIAGCPVLLFGPQKVYLPGRSSCGP